MEQWADESDDEYAARMQTARKVAAARNRYEQSPEYKSAKAKSAEFRKVKTMDSDENNDEETTLVDRLDALSGGIADNTATLRAGLGMDTTPEARSWAEAKLQETDPYAEKEQALTSKFQQTTRSTVDRLRAARAKLAAQQVDKRDFWLAMVQGAAMPNQGGKLGWTGNIAAAVRPALQAQHRFENDQQAGLDSYDKDIEEAETGDTALQLKMLQEKRKLWADERMKAANILGKNVPGAGKGSPGDTQTDKNYSKDYLDFLQNGQPVAERGLETLTNVANLLEVSAAEGKNYSGPMVGLLPKMGEAGKMLESAIRPDATDLRETIESEVQKTLRATLGAQFTAVEGNQVISRAYNPQLDEHVNARRLKALVTQLRKQYQAKMEMAQYYASHNNSLAGYEGPQFSPSRAVADNLTLLDSFDKAAKGALPPGTIVLQDKNNKSKTPVAPAKIEPVEIDNSGKKKERSFLDRMNPFAEGGAVNGEETDDRVTVQLPDGSIAYFPAGTTEEQVQQWFAGEERKRERKEALMNLGASGVAGAAGATAGYAGMRGLEGVAERMPYSPLRIRPGERRFVDAANRDSLDLSNVGQKLNELQRKYQIPAIGLDVLPTESRGLVNEAMRTGTPATVELQDALKNRNKEARADRLPSAVNKATAADPFLEQMMKLQGARSAAAEPLYQAMRKNQWVPADKVDVQWMLSTKPGQEAFDRANTKWSVDKANKGKVPYKANRNPITGKEGLPKAYSIDYLDQVKQALDDIEADATGKGYSSRDVADMRRRFLEEIDMERPDYAKARAAFHEGSKPLTALAIGRGDDYVKDMIYQDVDGKMVRAKGYMEMSPEEAKRYLAGIGGGDELENLRSGIAEAVTRELRGTAAKANPATALLENPDKMARLELALDPKEFNRLKQTLEHEAAAWDTSTEFGRKTESARGRARGAPVSSASELMPKTGRGIGKFVRALNPLAHAYRFSTPQADAGNKTSKFKPNEAEDIVKIASTRRAAELERLARAAGRRAGRGRRAGLAGLAAGLGAAGAAAYQNFNDEEEQP